MIGVCQGVSRFSRVLVAILVVASDVFAASPPEKPTPLQLPCVELQPWPDRPFAELVLDEPTLAAALLANPVWRSLQQAPWELPPATALAEELHRLLEGAHLPQPGTLQVVLGAVEGAAPSATVIRDTAAVRWPLSPPPTAAELARLLVPAVLAAAHVPAAPDPACSEPLLAMAEALVSGGRIALATLPPALRPVSDWFEPRDATSAIAAFAAQVLDPKVPWRVREAHAARLARGGASPQLANAAAVLLEAFADSQTASRRPCELLRAWRAARGKAYPSLPAALRRAINEGPGAGVPTGTLRGVDVERESADISRSALQRLLERGELPSDSLSPATPLAQRALAAANARSLGSPRVCELLGESLPAGLRTGCRERNESGGWVYVRPGERFDIVARASTGEEAVLLRWPRWVLFPLVGETGRDLFFVDEQGVQHVDLAGGAPPTLYWKGSFRTLARRPGAAGLAAVSWPSGEVQVEIGEERRPLGVKARAGLAWLDRDLLVAADDGALVLVSLTGQARRLPLSAPCIRSLAVSSGAVLAAQDIPCQPGLVRINLAEATIEGVLTPGFAPFGVLPLPDGTLVMGGAEGLYRWSGAGSAERIAAGITPGPG